MKWMSKKDNYQRKKETSKQIIDYEYINNEINK